MTQAEPELKSTPQIQSMRDVLRSLVGKLIVVSTPDSLKTIPLGHQIKPSCYKAKILKVFDAMALLAAEGSRKTEQEKPATLKQYLPLSVVKRVCISKEEIHLHL